MDDELLKDDEDVKAVQECDNPGGIALELLRELKSQNEISDKHNKRLTCIIIILILLLSGISIFHEYQWSKFDTIVVESKDGGNASYIGRDGDVHNNGKNSNDKKETGKEEEIEGNKN